MTFMYLYCNIMLTAEQTLKQGRVESWMNETSDRGSDTAQVSLLSSPWKKKTPQFGAGRIYDTLAFCVFG